MTLLDRFSPDEIRDLLAEATSDEMATILAALDQNLLEEDWREWLTALFPAHCAAPFAPHHEQLWDWVWDIQPGVRPDSLVAVFPRGGAKSTSAEMACVALGARRRRRYGLYVCAVQDQADDHVQNVAGLLESSTVERFYPELAERMVGKYGNSRGWRVNRLRTSSGFTIDAVGLDTAARGVKLEEARPDFLILDDLDNELDSPQTTERKIKTLTRGLLPAGSTDLAVLAIQNLVHPESIFARLAGVAEAEADFLGRRVVLGPIPAVEDLATEQREGRSVIVGGTPTWEGQNLDTCQDQIDDWGLSAFLAEAQHEVQVPPGGIFNHLDYRHCSWEEVPDLVRTTVWVDPAVTDTDASDSMGIQADGISDDGAIYRLFSWEQRTSPVGALKLAIAKAYEFGADHVGVETDQGGDTWRSVYKEALEDVLADHPEWVEERKPGFTADKAGAGHGPKTHRASKMLADYERGRIIHVLGTHGTLERALRRFPKTKPLDLVDASYWSWTDLRHGRRNKIRLIV